MSRIFYDDADRFQYGNFGRIEHEGKIYILEDNADFTNRVLDYDGYFELSVSAHDLDGNKFEVYWIFEEQEGWELDVYDYDNVDRIEER